MFMGMRRAQRRCSGKTGGKFFKVAAARGDLIYCIYLLPVPGSAARPGAGAKPCCWENVRFGDLPHAVPRGNRGAHSPPERLNPLVLAYVGDAVFELFVRTVLAGEHDAKAHALHVMSSRRVRAGAQAAAARGLFDELSEEERAVFLRGRNAKTHSAPRHAESGEYSYATALECLFGYLYLPTARSA